MYRFMNFIFIAVDWATFKEHPTSSWGNIISQWLTQSSPTAES